jgi:hypothetical protein
MVIKKINKISQKDINLLLKKFIIIIRKISNSCDNKKKNITKGGVFDFLKNKKEDKDLFNELNSFNDVEFKKSIQYFTELSRKFFEGIKVSEFITKDNINPYIKGTLNNTDSVKYNKHDVIEEYINNDSTNIRAKISNDSNNIISLSYDNYNSFILFYTDNENNIKYIYCKMKFNSINNNYISNYFLLNKKIYEKLNNNEEYILNNDEKSIISKYKQIFVGNTTNIKKLDPLILYLEYIKYFEELLSNNDNKQLEKFQFNIIHLKKMQELGGKIDYNILKNATIYNIGLILKTLKDILIDQ